MKVRIDYIDEQALAPEEIIAQIKRLHGKTATVKVSPDNLDPYSLVYFAIQELITSRQIGSFHDDGALYARRLVELRDEALELATEAIEQVIEDNETKLI